MFWQKLISLVLCKHPDKHRPAKIRDLILIVSELDVIDFKHNLFRFDSLPVGDE